MTKAKTTKRALLLSVLSMMLCVSMLVGSTFAWFTDSVNSGRNRIAAGYLDAKLFYKTGGMTEWRDVESVLPTDTDPFFRSVEGEKILWEPGAIGITSFKVENAGTLAFKYALAFLAVKYNRLDGRDLRDVIKFAVIDDELPENFTAEDAQNLNYSEFPNFTKNSSLLANDGVDDSGPDQEVFTVVAYWKPNTDGTDNLYNMSRGKTAYELDGTPSDPNQLYIDIDICLNAWQDTKESDSFNSQYDAAADALDIFPDSCYTVADHGAWVELDVYSGRDMADIHISYSGYAPDNTDERMRTWTTDSGGTITPTTANGSTHLIFFKTAEKGSFTLTQEDCPLQLLPVNEDGTPRQRRIVYSAKKAVAALSLSADLDVSDESGMKDVISNLNANGGETIVKLSGDIVLTGEWKLTNGTLTILGEGHSITCDNSTGKNFSITNTATLNLGVGDYAGNLTVYAGTTTQSALISIEDSACVNMYEGTALDGSAATYVALTGGIGMTGSAILNMYGGEIRNCRGRLGGAVGMYNATINGAYATLSQLCYTTFNMYGGTIKDCVSIGQAVIDFNKYLVAGGAAVCMCGYNTSTALAKFTMNGGSITGCRTEVENIPYDVYGGAIFVAGGNITLKDGEIVKNSVATNDSDAAAYGGGIGYYYLKTSTIEIDNNFKLYGNSAQTAGDDFSRATTNCTLKIKNAKTGFGGTLYPEQTGGKWYTDEKDKRYSDGKGTEVAFTAPTPDQTVNATTYKNIKVVHEEEPEPVTVTITYKDDLHAVDNYEQYTVEVGKPIPIPETIPYKKGYVFTGWIADDTTHPSDKTTAQANTTYYAEFCPLEGMGAPGRLLDLYNGEDNDAAISKGGAKTVRWLLEYNRLANRINADTPIKAGTKITMAYYPNENDRSVVNYYYLIVPADTTSISLGDFTAMGGSEHFVVSGKIVWNPICQFSFVFPETQENTRVWMSDTANDSFNGSVVEIAFSENRVATPTGTLVANGNTVTVSDLAGFAADQSDSRHITLGALADHKAVLVVEAVNAKGQTVAISANMVVTLDGKQMKVSTGIAVAEITEDGTYTIEVSDLPQSVVLIRISLCYTDDNIIDKPMTNVIASVTVNP